MDMAQLHGAAMMMTPGHEIMRIRNLTLPLSLLLLSTAVRGQEAPTADAASPAQDAIQAVAREKAHLPPTADAEAEEILRKRKQAATVAPAPYGAGYEARQLGTSSSSSNGGAGSSGNSGGSSGGSNGSGGGGGGSGGRGR